MITTRMYIYQQSEWKEYPLYNAVDFSERLDEEFDTAGVATITANIVPFDDYCMIKLVTSDGASEDKTRYFFGFDTVEKRGDGYYVHNLELCEPTRVLMGVPIDGRKITQPIDGSQKTSLYWVIVELLETSELLLYDDTSTRFTFNASGVGRFVERIFAPELHWEAGTLLWECLCDIGNVINCIPRVVPNSDETAFNVIKFEKINEITGEYEI